MNISTTSAIKVFERRPSIGIVVVVEAAARKAVQRLQQMPLLLWSLVLAAALLAFFVHLLNAQILRGEKLREDQRAAATRPLQRVSLAAGMHQPTNALIVTRQPMARP